MSIQPYGQITWREEPRPSDRKRVREIVVSSGFFSEAEIEVAVELVQERLNKGIESGYYFLLRKRIEKLPATPASAPSPARWRAMTFTGLRFRKS